MTGEELRAWRISAGLSQGQLARAIGVRPNNVCSMETGNRPIGAGMRMRVALYRIERMTERPCGAVEDGETIATVNEIAKEARG